MDYQELKSKMHERKREVVLGVCFVLVFLVGFGAGRYDKLSARNVTPLNQPHYTTPAANSKKQQPTPTPKPTVAVLSASTTETCLIKGNIASSGKKIFHVPGGAFYNTVKPEQCFVTEAAAQAAGFVKSSR